MIGKIASPEHQTPTVINTADADTGVKHLRTATGDLLSDVIDDLYIVLVDVFEAHKTVNARGKLKIEGGVGVEADFMNSRRRPTAKVDKWLSWRTVVCRRSSARRVADSTRERIILGIQLHPGHIEPPVIRQSQHTAEL